VKAINNDISIFSHLLHSLLVVQGFDDLVIDIGTLAPLKTFLYTHSFDTEQSIVGLHFYHATLVSDTLFPALGEVAVTVTEKL